MRYVAEHMRLKLEVTKGRSGPRKTDLVVSSAIDVVEHGSRCSSPGPCPEITDARGPSQAALTPRPDPGSRAEQWRKIGPLWNLSVSHGVL